MQNENGRPWLQQSRSWIFFKDQISKEPNIVSDFTEDNVFMLDCESARLSIWSRKWNTFIDVGVSSLLKEENAAKKIGKTILSGEIRVFYKGIELEKVSVRKDAGIIEFIDIKKDLEREYINISRGSFTGKGRHFFEEQLYPGLLEAVQKVLKYLALSANTKTLDDREEMEKESFSNKIEKNVDDRCKRILKLRESASDSSRKELAKLRNEIISLTVSVSVLAYFSARDEWNITETMDGSEYYEENEWLNLVEKIDKILAESEDEFILNELANTTKFFDIKVYGEDKKIKVNGVNDSKLKLKFRFTQIFLKENHWAILQVRKDSFSAWTSYLILLGDSKTGKSEEFKEIISFPHSLESVERLEKWAERLCNIVELSDDEADSRQQFIVNWMLKNIPTVGLFCNKEGNIRVNVLARRIYPSIFLNTNFKCLILDRIMEKAETDGIQRFSTIVWQGRENLGCYQLPFKIYFVKRGFFSSNSYHKIIIPFEGTLLKKWKKIIEGSSEVKDHVIALIDLIDMQYDAIFKNMNNEKQEEMIKWLREVDNERTLWRLSLFISELIFRHIKEKNYRTKYELKELLSSIEKEKSWKNLHDKMFQMGKLISLEDGQDQRDKLMKEIQNDEMFDKLCDVWIHLVFKQEQFLDIVNQVKEEYAQYIKENLSYEKKKEKIADYLIKAVPYPYDRRRMLQYIGIYENELLGLLHHMECQSVRQHIDKLFSNNMYLVSKLQDEKNK